jgi:hypothetical protein
LHYLDCRENHQATLIGVGESYLPILPKRIALPPGMAQYMMANKQRFMDASKLEIGKIKMERHCYDLTLLARLENQIHTKKSFYSAEKSLYNYSAGGRR